MNKIDEKEKHKNKVKYVFCPSTLIEN